MYEDIIGKTIGTKTLTSEGILRCPYCKGYKIKRASNYIPADGTNIKEEVLCEECTKKWFLVWKSNAKDFVRTESP